MTNAELRMDVAAARAASVPDAIIAEVVPQASNGASGTVARLADSVFKTYGGSVEHRTLEQVVQHLAGGPAPAAAAAPAPRRYDDLTYDEKIAACKQSVVDWQRSGGTPGHGFSPVAPGPAAPATTAPAAPAAAQAPQSYDQR